MHNCFPWQVASLAEIQAELKKRKERREAKKKLPSNEEIKPKSDEVDNSVFFKSILYTKSVHHYVLP